VFEQMKVGDTLAFEGPLGDFWLRDSERPGIRYKQSGLRLTAQR
jgi:NAD(P)H-flavin reductase